MKKLLLKLLLIALLIILPLQGFLFLAPMWYQNTDYVMWQAAWEMCETPHNALIIGDSRAKAGIKPNLLNDDTVSLTVGGGTPAEGYYLLKRYLAFNEAPEYIILSFAPFDLTEHGWLWYRTVKYGFLSLSDQAEILRAYPNSTAGRIKDYTKLLLYRAKYPKYYMSELKAFIENPKANIEKNRATCARLNLLSGYHWFSLAEYSDKLNVETGYADFTPTAVLDDYLRRILSLCEAEDIPVAYVTMPMNTASYAALKEDYKTSYAAYLSGLEDDYDGLTVLYGITQAPNNWFSDASHFNTEGAKQFTAALEAALGGQAEEGQDEKTAP